MNILYNKKYAHNKLFYVVTFLILYSIVFPTFNNVFTDASFGVGAVVVNIVPLIVCTFLFIFYSIKYPSALYKINMLFFLYFGVIIAAATAFSPNQLIFRDIFELHRPVFFGFVFSLPFFVHWDNRKIIRFIIFPLLIVFTINIFLAYLNVLPVPRELRVSVLGLYTKARNVTTLRASGFFVNPYDYGFMVLVPVIMYIYYMFALKNWKLKVISFLVVCLGIGAVLISQSRTAFVVLGFGISYSLILYVMLNHSTRKRIRILLFVILVIAAIFASYELIISYLETNYPYLYSGIQTILDQGLSEQSSFAARLRQMDFVLQEFEQRPLLGYGPSKDVREFLEMQYILYLYRYGILGFLFMLWVMVFSIIISIKVLIFYKKANVHIVSYLFSFHVWAMVLPIASLGNCFIEIIRISFYFYFSLGLLTLMNSKKYKHPLFTTKI